MARLVCCALFALIALPLLSATMPVLAQDGWLRNPLVPWNSPGMAVPSAPLDVPSFIEPLCARSVRPPETREDQEVASQGWVLFGPYEGGWGIRTIGGTAGFDGMCRPTGYQYFIFMDGEFAGTLSPVPMAARSTGAGRILAFDSEHRVTANFVRYANEDPLCCPSRPSVSIELRIEDTEQGPVEPPRV